MVKSVKSCRLVSVRHLKMSCCNIAGGFFCCIRSQSTTAAPSNRKLKWSECEEVCVPEGACWQRSLLFHTEKLPTLGFVYSWIIEDARTSCVCASVCECVSCLNTATVCLTLWLRKHSHSACLKATGAQVHMAVTSQWRRVCLFFLFFLSSRPAWLMKKMPVRGRSHPRRERSHWTWTFSTYFCI